MYQVVQLQPAPAARKVLIVELAIDPWPKKAKR